MVNKSLAPIAVQEPLLVERLRTGFPAQIFTIERVSSAMTKNEFNRWINNGCFLGLAWNGMKAGDTERRLTGDQRWSLFIVYRSTGSLEARFKGDSRGLGMDAMVDVACALIHGFSNTTGRCAVTAANAVVPEGFADDAVVVAQVDFTFSFATDTAALDIEASDDLAAIGVTWSLADAPEGAPTQTDIINPGA
ncbi:hypothetical protein [Rhizobium sp. C1]|uniref:hypothetical protein n=1 Tax=Rhizobium sp. C1 TaxID=1349799 RepID=UPI001E39F2B0|nr:hypothetical protein [Rhizobium sp. C1]MCD2176445.1 hypothetical protein [Rhizobium sp. C1]